MLRSALSKLPGLNSAVFQHSTLPAVAHFSTSSLLSEKVVAVFPTGGEASKEPRYVCCVENGLGLPGFLKGKAELVVTADKEGAGSGMH